MQGIGKSRRRHSEKFQQQVMGACAQPGASVLRWIPSSSVAE
jgi:hypothetical protein